MQKIAIIGGGISGLATAYYVEKLAREAGRQVACTVIESTPLLGGKITTIANADFLLEAGPDSFVTRKPWAYELCLELGLTDQLIPLNPAARNFQILRRSRLTSYPLGFHLGITRQWQTLLTTSLLSPAGKFRYLQEWFSPRRKSNQDESLAEFMSRHFGDEALETLFVPLLAGIYAGDPNRMSMESYYPSFIDHEVRYGSLIKGVKTEIKAEQSGKNQTVSSPIFVSHQYGMQAVVSALATKIKGTVMLNQRAIRINPNYNGSYEVLIVPGGVAGNFQTLVVTTSSMIADKLIGTLNPILSSMLQSIRHASSTIVCLSYAKKDVDVRWREGLGGFLVPRQEKRRIVGGSWLSNKFAGRAPDDTMLLRVFLGGDGQEEWAELPDDAMLKLVAEELQQIIGLNAKPVLQQIFRWPKGNPLYDVGHQLTLKAIDEQLQKFPGLYLTGCSYRGIGIPDCIRQAREVAEKVVGRLAKEEGEESEDCRMDLEALK